MHRVLVTGGSGFIGSQAILRLLATGHKVRTTVRDLGRESHVRALLASGGADGMDRLSFVAADLMRDDGWREAADGCEYVLHIASPFPATIPEHEDDLIVPARDGALRVLRAARDTGVSRMVMTSSFAAVGYGHEPRATPFDESSWTDLDGRDVTPYVKSKTIAERAAWDFVEAEGGGLELSVLNPVGVFGPVLGPDFSTSIRLIQRLMDGQMPGCPKLAFGVVDVRDVVDLHLLAMTREEAKGERFLAVSGESMSILEMGDTLRSRLGEAARKVPRHEIPSWLVRIVALWDGEVRSITPELGRRKDASSEKARRLLGWSPRSREDAIAATAESLLELGLLEHAS